MSGSKLVQKLPHANFYISQVAGPDGGYVGLFEGIDPNSKSDPGTVMRDWFKGQADTTRTRLRAMNTANAAFWGKAVSMSDGARRTGHRN